MYLTKSFLSCLCVERTGIAKFLLNTSTKDVFRLAFVLTSGGKTMVAVRFSFKSKGIQTNSFLSSTIILWRITPTCIILTTSSLFHNLAGRLTISKQDCNTLNTHSTSFLAGYCWRSLSPKSDCRLYSQKKENHTSYLHISITNLAPQLFWRFHHFRSTSPE